jgi:hypothetical protein
LFIWFQLNCVVCVVDVDNEVRTTRKREGRGVLRGGGECDD